MKFSILVDSSLVIIIIYAVCLIYEREWRRLLNIYCIFTIEFLWPRQKTRTFALKVTKFTILVDPLWFIINIYSVCLIYAQEVRRISNKYINFIFLFYSNISPLGMGGHEIHNALSSSHTCATYFFIWYDPSRTTMDEEP